MNLLICRMQMQSVLVYIFIFYLCFHSSEYGLDYFKQFNVVMNALDNRGEVFSSFCSLLKRRRRKNAL